MGWESRGTSGTMYYYEAARGADGSPRKTYLGRGPMAQRSAAAAEARVADRERDRQAITAAAAQVAAAERLAAMLDEAARVTTAAALVAAGCHRHNGGPWRRRRARHQPPAGPGADGRGAGRD